MKRRAVKRWLALFALATACGQAPQAAQVSFVAQGLAAADVQILDVYLLDVSAAGRAKTCADLGTAVIASHEDVDVVAYQKLAPSSHATFPGLADGQFLIVAEAYGDTSGTGSPIARACAKVPPIYRDETTRVTLVLEALP
jgi:hypothetical protein